MSNLDDLATFVAVASAGSFTGAAKELGVPKSTVSRRVARLEEALGVQLVRRGPRSFKLTQQGLVLQARTEPALREIAEVERTVTELDAESGGQLRITAPLDLGWTPDFAGMLAAYRRRWPRVDLQVELSDVMLDLVEGGFDLGLRIHFGTLPDTAGLMTRRVARVRAHVFASPGYLERRGIPRVLDDLKKHDCVVAKPAGTQWVLQQEPDAKPVTVKVEASIEASDFVLASSLVRAGAGVGLLPTFQARHALADGSMLRILSPYGSPAASMSLVWPTSRHPSPRLRSFLDFAIEWMRDDRQRNQASTYESQRLPGAVEPQSAP